MRKDAIPIRTVDDKISTATKAIVEEEAGIIVGFRSVQAATHCKTIKPSHQAPSILLVRKKEKEERALFGGRGSQNLYLVELRAENVPNVQQMSVRQFKNYALRKSGIQHLLSQGATIGAARGELFITAAWVGIRMEVFVYLTEEV
jgi:hypothetical protein